MISKTVEQVDISVSKGTHEDVVWNDIILPPDRLGQGASSPDREVLIGNIQAFAFDGGVTTEQLFGSFELVHDYKEETDLRPHIHWATNDNLPGNVKWFLEYSIANRNDALNTVQTISVVTAASGVDRDHIIVELPIIDGTGLKIGAACNFRFYRDPADAQDDYNTDAFLLSLGIHYESEGDGSNNIMNK